MRPQRGNRVTKSGKAEDGQLLSKFFAWNQRVARQFLMFNQLCMFFQNNQALLHSALEEASLLPSSSVDLLALFANFLHALAILVDTPVVFCLSSPSVCWHSAPLRAPPFHLVVFFSF